MLPRIVTGLTLAGLVLAVTLAGPPWATAVVVLVVCTICWLELYQMMLPGRLVEQAVGVALGTALCGSASFLPQWLPWVAMLAVATPALCVLARPEPIDEAARRLLVLWGGLVYVGGTLGTGLALADRPRELILACTIVFMSDTGAYFVGRALGRHKLYEKISPKKTVEGAVGGLLASVLGGFVGIWALGLDLGWPLVLGLGVGGAVMGQLGDLVESMLKRSAGVKDSGKLLPGHGGFLDRVDGLMFALPLFVVVLSPR
jgi:phosphatidate cytidylyltransferase